MEVITMRHLVPATVTVVTVIVTLTVLLVVMARPAQADRGEEAPDPTDDGSSVEDSALVCLALVGGTALLAGGVWIKNLSQVEAKAIPAPVARPAWGRREDPDCLRGEFIQNASHEPRAPLTIIRGYAELLDDGGLGELQPEQQERAPMHQMLGESSKVRCA
jgi:signal transduction histidine kinase